MFWWSSGIFLIATLLIGNICHRIKLFIWSTKLSAKIFVPGSVRWTPSWYEKSLVMCWWEIKWNLLFLHSSLTPAFDLTFEKWFVSFPNKNNRETYLKCRPPWLGDKENFFKMVLNNSIFVPFYSTEKHQICILYQKTFVLKDCVKNHLKVFLIKLSSI